MFKVGDRVEARQMIEVVSREHLCQLSQMLLGQLACGAVRHPPLEGHDFTSAPGAVWFNHVVVAMSTRVVHDRFDNLDPFLELAVFQVVPRLVARGVCSQGQGGCDAGDNHRQHGEQQCSLQEKVFMMHRSISAKRNRFLAVSNEWLCISMRNCPGSCTR